MIILATEEGVGGIKEEYGYLWSQLYGVGNYPLGDVVSLCLSTSSAIVGLAGTVSKGTGIGT